MDLVRMEALAGGKSGGASSALAQWRIALGRLLSTGVSDEEAERLLSAEKSPAALSRLARAMEGGGARASSAIFADCDASAHPLSDWLEGVDILLLFLEERGKRAGAIRASGYVSCSSAAAPEAKLPATVRAMLEQYGFDESAG